MGQTESTPEPFKNLKSMYNYELKLQNLNYPLIKSVTEFKNEDKLLEVIDFLYKNIVDDDEYVMFIQYLNEILDIEIESIKIINKINYIKSEGRPFSYTDLIRGKFNDVYYDDEYDVEVLIPDESEDID